MTLFSPNGAPLQSEVMRALSAHGAAPDPNVTPINQRQLDKELAHTATVRDVVEIAHLKATQAASHLAKQLPGNVENLVRAMLSEAMVALVPLLVQTLEERFVMTPREKPPEAPNA